MKVKWMLLLILLTSQAFAVTVGDFVNYKYRGLGESFSSVTETIDFIDNEFNSHLVSRSSDGMDEWRRNDQSYMSSSEIQKVLDNCSSHYFGTIEYLLLENGNTAKTCKLEVGPMTGLIRGSVMVGFNRIGFYNLTWIGHGPYNGIYKYIDYQENYIFILRDFETTI
jgi:hypothetical protein